MLNKLRRASAPGGTVVLLAGLAVFAGAIALLFLTGNTGIRYSADHDDTIPLWHRWIPALVGIVLVRLVSPDLRREPVVLPAGKAVRVEASVLTAAAVLFAVLLWSAGGGEPAHTALKLLLLLGVPAVTFWLLRRKGAARTSALQGPGSWRHWGPLIPVVTWFALSYAGPLALPRSDLAFTVDPVTLIVTMVVVFLINSLLEEIFYRRWLQTRWEFLLGRWPAIVLASLLWAVWHVAIQGNGELGVDLASVVVNQGVLGLFLGYLWSKYRLMWPLLVVHGATNAAPILLGLL
ncbi:CPBP family intramembrane glutamic endopeptidase [Saccharopolyspora shandongensis]|uniref:CPBP family intramembrane glutamic endopeptidase n=1 Tax=Saccharopolyspora shandongensis TaxID=418495 RepID=UPI0015A68FCB|nr:CPBP family intramembrane glutamic endopeptidase [Saccharopolyspora shandongensis]